jgi:hypothetical protein
MFIKIHTEYCGGIRRLLVFFVHAYLYKYIRSIITMFSRQNLLNQKPFVTMNTSNTTFLG